MPSGTYTLSNALYREVGASQPQKYQLEAISVATQAVNPVDIRSRSEGAFKRESLLLLGEIM
jgi:hypothetical protein